MANTGMKRADYFKDFHLPKVQKQDDKPKGASKGTSILNLMKQQGPPNTIIIIPRTGGLVSLVVQGLLFRELRQTLEDAVPALRPTPEGAQSNTARELALRIGYGTNSNGYTHNIEGVMRNLIGIVVHTYFHKAQEAAANLNVYTCEPEDTNLVSEIGARVNQVSKEEMHNMMSQKSLIEFHFIANR